MLAYIFHPSYALHTIKVLNFHALLAMRMPAGKKRLLISGCSGEGVMDVEVLPVRIERTGTVFLSGENISALQGKRIHDL